MKLNNANVELIPSHRNNPEAPAFKKQEETFTDQVEEGWCVVKCELWMWEWM
jgi:hypothetical protein